MRKTNDPKDNHRVASGVPDLESGNENAVAFTTQTDERVERGIRTCKVTIIAGRKKLCDPDNIHIKACIDAIKGEGGFIADDSGRYISALVIRQEKTKTPFTRIEIEFEEE